MGGPAWLSYAFAAVMLAVAGFCTGQLIVVHRTRRPAEIDSGGQHVLMGVAMAGMLVARLRFGGVVAWDVVFGVLAAWFGWQALRGRFLGRRGRVVSSPWRCPLPVVHLVECGAMLFMLVVLPAIRVSGGAAAGMAMPAADARWSLLSLVFAMVMLGYVVWLADQLGLSARVASTASAGFASAAACARAGTLAPRCTLCCKMAMGITMGYMLILTL